MKELKAYVNICVSECWPAHEPGKGWCTFHQQTCNSHQLWKNFMSLFSSSSPQCCQHVYVMPVKAMVFLCQCRCDQPYPTYSAILGLCAHCSLDVQTGAVESRPRGRIPCSLQGTKYGFSSQICNAFPLELLCKGPTLLKQHSLALHCNFSRA